MRFDWKHLAKRAKLPAAGVAVLAMVGGAYWLGGLPPAETATPTSATVQDEPRDRQPGEQDSKPAPVSVPRSAAGARSSGGHNWVTGDTGRLGADFRRSVSSQFGDGTIGQAHKGMAGLGFQCSFGSGGAMNCTKSLRADNCTLTWSVRLKSDGGDVGSAGGEGFSRSCD